MGDSFNRTKNFVFSSPPVQGFLILFFSLVLVFFFKSKVNAWLISATGILLFATGTTVLGLFRKNWKSYLIQSVITYIICIVAIIYFTRIITDIPLKQEQDVYYFFIAESIFYFSLNFLAAIFRSIIKFLDKI
jgi:hypothetical protein